MSLDEISTPSRVAGPEETISEQELALAARNHGFPLEALRHDVTPLGLHYLLTHYDIPAIDPLAWRLRLRGRVERELELTLADLQAMPSSTVRVTMECAGNGRARLRPRPVSQPWLVEAVGTADWTGVGLHHLLERAGLDPSAVEVAFTGADHGVERGVEQDYQRGLPLDEALLPDVTVAYAMNGAPLPPQHGAPVRLVVPGWYGMAHVKWLVDVEVLNHAFAGYQNTVAYRVRTSEDDPGVPVTRIAPKSLIMPPGFPDFMSRTRVVRPGAVTLEGRAWSGQAPVARVEVSVDSGKTWADAALEPAGEHRWAWRRWTLPWTVTPGEYTLMARATTADGETQTIDQTWNAGGFVNSAAHVVQVVCLP